MKISIIIPTVGRRTLGGVLEALFLNKKFDQINPEILVVFDGRQSSNFVIEHDNVKILETGEKVGVSGTRNFGIEKSIGDVIVFIGDDTFPDKNWLQKIHIFHSENSNKNQALLGRIHWTEDLIKDPFHVWLESHAQFDFKNLDKGKTPDWHHFYTSNISLKRELIGEQRFSEKFYGWGFEDSELGYRLEKKGMQIHYDKLVEVFHDHRQTLEKMMAQTRQARSNALTFERLHPEIEILPKGLKKWQLQIFIFVVAPFSFIKRVYWWRCWKKAWLGKI